MEIWSNEVWISWLGFSSLIGILRDKICISSVWIFWSLAISTIVFIKVSSSIVNVIIYKETCRKYWISWSNPRCSVYINFISSFNLFYSTTKNILISIWTIDWITIICKSYNWRVYFIVWSFYIILSKVITQLISQFFRNEEINKLKS